MRREHILVIGGSKGTGRAIVRTLNSKRCNISVISRKKPHEQYKGVRYWAVDITKKKVLQSALKKIVAKNGKFNHLVFCQQFRGQGDDWNGQLSTSLTAVKNIIESASKDFEDRKKTNTITIISSIASHLIAKEQPLSYHVGKAGMEQLTRYYAFVLGPKGIRVNSISPNLILKEENKPFYKRHKKLYELYTKISPLGKMVNASDVAEAVAFFCSSRSSSITGQNIVIDGGVSLQEHASLARTIKCLDHIRITQKKYRK